MRFSSSILVVDYRLDAVSATEWTCSALQDGREGAPVPLTVQARGVTGGRGGPWFLRRCGGVSGGSDLVVFEGDAV